jgi:Secretion system C-terminal sorting domain
MKTKITILIAVFICTNLLYSQTQGYLMNTSDTSLLSIYHAYGIAQSNSGSIYESSITITAQYNYAKGTIKKSDANGNTLWTIMCLDESIYDINIPVGICTQGNSVYLAGRRTTSLQEFGTLTRADTSGNIIWARSINQANFLTSTWRVCNGPSESCIVGGFMDEIQTPYFFGAICRFDSAGTMLWGKSILLDGYLTTIFNDVFYDNNNNIYAVGYGKVNSAADNDGIIVKLDVNGNVLWTKTYDLYQSCRFISILQYGNDLYLCGNYRFTDSLSSTIYEYPALTKIDSSGNHIWTRGYLFSQHNSGGATDITILASGNIVLNTYTDDVNPNTPRDYMIVEADTSGNFLQALRFPPYYILEDVNVNIIDNRLLVNGAYDPTINDNERFLAHFSLTNFQNTCGISLLAAPQDSILFPLAIGNTWQEYGVSSDTLPTNSISLNPPETRCDFIIGLEEQEQVAAITAFPNPSFDRITIRFGLQQEAQIARLYNAQGQLVREMQITNGMTELHVDKAELPAGIYFWSKAEQSISIQFIK